VQPEPPQAGQHELGALGGIASAERFGDHRLQAEGHAPEDGAHLRIIVGLDDDRREHSHVAPVHDDGREALEQRRRVPRRRALRRELVECAGDAVEEAGRYRLDEVLPLGEVVREVRLAHLRPPRDPHLRQPAHAVLLQRGHGRREDPLADPALVRSLPPH
jgi:hypothetical protein